MMTYDMCNTAAHQKESTFPSGLGPVKALLVVAMLVDEKP